MMLHLESIKDNHRVKDIFELPKYYNVCYVCVFTEITLISTRNCIICLSLLFST